jgi:hypothetical protein
MSASDYDVMQDKDADTPMVWNDFVELHNHLEGVLESSTQEALNAHQELQVQVKGTTKILQLCRLSSLLSSKALIS